MLPCVLTKVFRVPPYCSSLPPSLTHTTCAPLPPPRHQIFAFNPHCPVADQPHRLPLQRISRYEYIEFNVPSKVASSICLFTCFRSHFLFFVPKKGGKSVFPYLKYSTLSADSPSALCLLRCPPKQIDHRRIFDTSLPNFPFFSQHNPSTFSRIMMKTLLKSIRRNQMFCFQMSHQICHTMGK